VIPVTLGKARTALKSDHKVIIIGDANVGKTTLLRRYLDDIFLQKTRPTIGVDTEMKKIRAQNIVNGTDTLQTVRRGSHKFKYWDLAGQSVFSQLRPNYMKNAQAIMLCFSLDDQGSFFDVDNLDKVGNSFGKFLKELYTAFGSTKLKRVPCLLVGTKDDLRNRVYAPYINFIARKLIEAGMNLILWTNVNNRVKIYTNSTYDSDAVLRRIWNDKSVKRWIATSAKENTNIEVAFNLIHRSIIER